MVKTDEIPLWPQLDVKEHGLKMCHICLRVGNPIGRGGGACLNHNISSHSVTGNRRGVIYWSDWFLTLNTKCIMLKKNSFCQLFYDSGFKGLITVTHSIWVSLSCLLKLETQTCAFVFHSLQTMCVYLVTAKQL